MKHTPILPLLTLATALVAAPRPAAPAAESANGYIAAVPAESATARTQRHERVARRRAQETCVIVHRGGAAFAPENTLEAYAAAMDYGADGCEVDLRRTADGVLVLFHDDMLDHLTEGFGNVPQVSYYELLSLKPRFRYGTATASTRPPTFAALLTLAHQRAMLLHLDVKETGLDAQISAMLEQADAWDHVAGVNSATAPTLAKDPRITTLKYRGPGLFENRLDMDPEAVRAQLARPGNAVMVDDPRLAARELKRPPYAPVPLPHGLRADWPVLAAAEPRDPNLMLPQQFLRRFAAETSLTEHLQAVVPPLSPGTDGTPEYEYRRTGRILERAWAAQELGKRGVRDRRTVELLERTLQERTLHRDWMYHGLDGAMAARALGRLGARESVPALVRALKRVDPALEAVQNKSFGPYPLAWTDFRTKMYVLPALGELPCAESKQALLEYLALPEAEARELGPLQYDEATRAAFHQDLSQAEIEGTLRSPRSAVRGTAIQECLDHPTRVRTRALRAAAGWALELPAARR